MYDWQDRLNVGAQGQTPREDDAKERQEEQEDVAIEIVGFATSPVYGMDIGPSGYTGTGIPSYHSNQCILYEVF